MIDAYLQTLINNGFKENITPLFHGIQRINLCISIFNVRCYCLRVLNRCLYHYQPIWYSECRLPFYFFCIAEFVLSLKLLPYCRH